ncbi:MAG: hypothetical protein ACT4RN_10755 [Pseudonocardia sp.]
MTVLDHRPRPTYAPRLHRRHEIVTTGGLEGILQVSAILADHLVREFVADVREGVVYSSIMCTVALTDDECHRLVERLHAASRVTSVSPC